ncbi:MAG: hypothetical protein ABSH08_09875 [Tepidisphaeraceae bacterium]
MSLPASQLSFLDGIRLTGEMYHLAYARLLGQLETISPQMEPGSEVKFDAACIFLDAWSMVDSLNRFRELVAQLPGLKKKQPAVRLFLEKTAGAETLRNIVQHLRQEIPSMTTAGKPVLGSLHWVYFVKTEPSRIRSCTVIAGRLQTGSHPILNPLGKPIAAPVDHITLRCKDSELSLTKCYEDCRRLLKNIERSIENSFGISASSGSDLFLAVDFAIPTAKKGS